MTEASTAQQIQLLLRTSATASLGTRTQNGSPFVTLVTVAQVSPTSLAMLLSGLAKHTTNLTADTRGSLLLSGSPAHTDGDPMATARVTLTGEIVRIRREDDAAIRQTFLASHPSAAMYADFGDFAFYEFQIDEAHLVAGFGRIQTLSARQLQQNLST